MQTTANDDHQPNADDEYDDGARGPGLWRSLALCFNYNTDESSPLPDKVVELSTVMSVDLGCSIIGSLFLLLLMVMVGSHCRKRYLHKPPLLQTGLRNSSTRTDRVYITLCIFMWVSTVGHLVEIKTVRKNWEPINGT